MTEKQLNFQFSPQCSVKDKGDYYLIYNWENSKEVHIKKNLIKDISDETICLKKNFKEEDINYLINNYFIDNQISKDKINNRIASFFEKKKDFINLTLMPAGYQCNFRCKYCYEIHDAPNRYGKDELNYFVSLCEKRKKNLHIEFFGGEPLLNYTWIKEFVSKLGKIRYSMTTNGYLLDKEKISFLINAGVTTFQITIDGLEEDHNYLRPLKNGKGSWSRIIENLKYFKELNSYFLVIIRINFNITSIDEGKLEKLLKILSFTKADIRFKYIFRGIGNYSEANNTSNQETTDALYKENDSFEKILNYSNLLLDKEYFLGDIRMFTNLGGIICYASYPQNIVVNGVGELLRCTISVDQSYNKFGKINFRDLNHPNFQSVTNQKWDSCLKIADKCYDCKILFQCLGRNCPIKNLLHNMQVCPRERKYINDILELIIRQKELLKKIHNREN